MNNVHIMQQIVLDGNKEVSLQATTLMTGGHVNLLRDIKFALADCKTFLPTDVVFLTLEGIFYFILFTVNLIKFAMFFFNPILLYHKMGEKVPWLICS
jgi:hypothetical protein